MSEYIEHIPISYQEEKSEFVLSIVIDNRKEAWQSYIQHLSGEEYLLLQNQKTEEAKNSFCLGKIAAKTTIDKFLQVPFNTLTIKHGVFGFPVIHPETKGIQVSIAHTASSGTAVSFSEKFPIGIDMEILNITHNATIQTALINREVELIQKTQETLYSHIIWSAKEALSKALKTGFLLPIPLLEIKSISPQENCYKVEFKNFSLFTGIVFQLKEYIIALVVPTRLTVNTDFISAIHKRSREY